MIKQDTLVKEDYKLEELTWRQSQVLLSIYKRIEENGYATAGNLVFDFGLSIATVGNHLRSLYRKGLVLQPEGKNVKNLDFDRHLLLTGNGIYNSEYYMSEINASKTESITTISEKNLNYRESTLSPTHGWDCYKKTPSQFSKGFNEILEQNPIEPFTVSMAMYSELDGQLALLSRSNDELYKSLSRNNLHMQIRNGRIASIAIPISLRGSISQNELDEILGNNWSWLGITKGHSSAQRYLKEVLSLGIAHKQGNVLTSLNPTTTDTISWLSNKVNSAFQNTITPVPKVALLAFRETFKYPTEEDLLNPQNSDIDLDWLNTIHEKMDKTVYTNSVKNGIDLLVNQANIVESCEGRLVPKTALRKIKSAPEIEKNFKFLLKRADEGNVAATILLTITAKPGITLTQLDREINKPSGSQRKELDSALNTLIETGLISPSHAKHSSNEVRYYAFTHIPYLIDNKVESLKANAIFKNMQPDMLTKINSMFPDLQEKKDLYEVINIIYTKKCVDLNYLDQFGPTFRTKMILLSSSSINPFIKLDPTYSSLVLEGSKISEIILNVIQYSIKANNQSIGVYSPTLSTMLMKDKKYYQKIGEGAEELKTEIFDAKLKHIRS